MLCPNCAKRGLAFSLIQSKCPKCHQTSNVKIASAVIYRKPKTGQGNTMQCPKCKANGINSTLRPSTHREHKGELWCPESTCRSYFPMPLEPPVRFDWDPISDPIFAHATWVDLGAEFPHDFPVVEHFKSELK